MGVIDYQGLDKQSLIKRKTKRNQFYF